MTEIKTARRRVKNGEVLALCYAIREHIERSHGLGDGSGVGTRESLLLTAVYAESVGQFLRSMLAVDNGDL